MSGIDAAARRGFLWRGTGRRYQGNGDPAKLSESPLSQAVLHAGAKAATAMAEGCLLLEGGSRYFAYRHNEPIELGATVINAGRTAKPVGVRFSISAGAGPKAMLEKTVFATVPPNEQRQVSLKWSPPPALPQRPREVFVELVDPTSRQPVDAISHEIDALSENPARPDEFVKVEGREEGTPWREAAGGEISVKKVSAVQCRVSVGNTAEAAWLAPPKDADRGGGGVFLRCTVHPSGKTLDVPIPRSTPYLADAELGEFTVPLSDEREQTVTLRMLTARQTNDGSTLTIPFGEKQSIRVIGP